MINLEMSLNYYPSSTQTTCLPEAHHFPTKGATLASKELGVRPQTELAAKVKPNDVPHLFSFAEISGQ
jgi:hypothetical protein